MRGVRHALHLDGCHLTPSAAVAVHRFRTMRGRLPPANVPIEFQPIIVGAKVPLKIDGAFPLTTCFLQVSLDPTLSQPRFPP
eukprot:6629830-Prymnesium_polylepis.2